MSQYNPPLGSPGQSGIGGGGAGAGLATATVVVWESNGNYAAERTADGTVIASGIDWDEVMRVGVLATANVGGGILFVRAGSYVVESGVTISGDVAIVGEGGLGASLQAGSFAGTVSGIFKMAGTVTTQRISDFDIQCNSGAMLGIHVPTNASYARIDNVLIQAPTLVSGSKAISLNNTDDTRITNIKEIRNWANGIYLNGTSCLDNQIDGATFVGCGYGIVVNGGAANIIDNIIGGSANDSGVVLLESGARRNIVTNVTERTGLTPAVVVRFSGIDNYIDNIVNASGGPAVVIQDNARNQVGAHYPDVGVTIPAQYTIWVSGTNYVGVRNTDGIIIVSGTNAADVFDDILTLAQTEGLVHVKRGSYNFTSGFLIGAGTTLIGAGERTNFNFDASSGRISGAIMPVGSAIRLRDFNILCSSGVMCGLLIHPNVGGIDVQDIGIFGPGSTESGTAGISIEASQENEYRNIDISSFSLGIRMISGTGGTPNTWEARIEGIRIDDVQTGILLDNVYNNIIDNVHIDAPASGGIVLTNMARRNTIDNIISNSATRPAVVMNTSGGSNQVGSVINASGGSTISVLIKQSTDRFAGYFNDIGMIVAPQWTIWESGGDYFTKRTADGVTILSDWPAEIIFNEVTVGINAIGGGTALVKNGTYNFNSGVVMPPNGIFIGEGQNTELNFSAVSGRVSGCLDFGGSGQQFKNFLVVMQSGCYTAIHGQANNNYLTIENVTIVGPTSANSGTKAIQLEASQNNVIKNVEIGRVDIGIQMVSGPGATPTTFGNFVDTVQFRSGVNTGILLENVYANSISNIHHNTPTSGCIIIANRSRRNTIDNIISDSTTIPGVVIQASGVDNRITNISNSSGGPCVFDLTSGARNFVLPGELQPVVLLSGTGPFTYVNASGRQEMVTIGGGSVNSLDFIRAGTTTNLSGLVAGSFILNAGDKLVINHSGMPTMNIIPTG